jgi:hypothetical protein
VAWGLRETLILVATMVAMSRIASPKANQLDAICRRRPSMPTMLASGEGVKQIAHA